MVRGNRRPAHLITPVDVELARLSAAGEHAGSDPRLEVAVEDGPRIGAPGGRWRGGDACIRAHRLDR